jgi:exopolysaccharide biosynthesis polyprenyl glycosylphosphotransferase
VADQQKSFGNRRLRYALVASDVIALSASWIVAASLGLNHRGAAHQEALFGLVLVGVTLGLFFTSRLYRSRMCSVRALETAAVLRACLLGGLLTWMVAGRLSLTTVRVRAVVVAQILAVGFVFVGRAIYRKALQKRRSNGHFARPVVLIGGGEEVYELNKMLTSEPELGYRVIGSIGTAGEMSAWATELDYLGPLANTVEIMHRHNASGAIVSGSGLSIREMNRVVREIMDAGMHVQLFGGLLGIDPSRLQVNPIGGEAAFYLEQVALTGFQSQLKRAVDIVLGLVGLVLTAPIVAVFALLARLDGGTSFFRQVRVGRDGRTFTMIKIRTMIMDAEKLRPALDAENERLGPLFKMERDPRFTKLGRFMDATSINELPQFWNVLRGDMSLVGPRPALASEAATFNDRLLMRNRVRPGITGLWQIQGRDTASFATYERCDVFYVENWSTRLDMMILAQTGVHIVARATVWRRRAAIARHPSEMSVGQLPSTIHPAFGDVGDTSGVTVPNG